METEFIITPCPACGTKNRIPKHRKDGRPVCGQCRHPLRTVSFPDHPVEVTDDSFAAEVASFPGSVVLDCWAPWCGPCRMLAPVLEQLAQEYAGRIKFAKLNTDQNPQTSARFSVQSIPTLLFFKNGKLVHRLIGALPKAEIERQLPILL